MGLPVGPHVIPHGPGKGKKRINLVKYDQKLVSSKCLLSLFSKLMVTKGVGGGGWDEMVDWDLHIYTAMHKINN